MVYIHIQRTEIMQLSYSLDLTIRFIFQHFFILLDIWNLFINSLRKQVCLPSKLTNVSGSWLNNEPVHTGMFQWDAMMLHFRCFHWESIQKRYDNKMRFCSGLSLICQHSPSKERFLYRKCESILLIMISFTIFFTEKGVPLPQTPWYIMIYFTTIY